jgi:hypothetical protein
MKKFLIALSLLFVFGVNSQTQVSGGIYQNTTWTAASSPYIVTGSIVVFPQDLTELFSNRFVEGLEVFLDKIKSPF